MCDMEQTVHSFANAEIMGVRHATKKHMQG